MKKIISSITVGGDVYNDDNWDITIRNNKLKSTLYLTKDELQELYNILKTFKFLNNGKNINQ